MNDNTIFELEAQGFKLVSKTGRGLVYAGHDNLIGYKVIKLVGITNTGNIEEGWACNPLYPEFRKRQKEILMATPDGLKPVPKKKKNLW